MLKTLASYIQEYKVPSFKAMFYVTLEVIMEVLIPYLMSDLVDKGIANGNMNIILKTGLFMILASIFSLQEL